MRKTTTKELIVYILFIIVSVVMVYPFYLLEQDSYNFTWFWLSLVGVIAFFTLFGFIIRFCKKPVVFVCLFPALVVITLFVLDYPKLGFYCGCFVGVEILLLACKAKEYYHIFFTEGYVTEREKREARKKNEPIIPIADNHADEFKFDSSVDSTIIRPYNTHSEGKKFLFDKTKEINLRGETIELNYDTESNSSEYVLHFGHSMFNPGDRADLFDEFGSDDTSGNIVSICDNHVFEDNFSEVHYFDLNDVEKVKLVEEYDEFLSYYFEFTFKDGKKYCLYTDDYDMENIKRCILSARRDLKIINNSTFLSSSNEFNVENTNLEIKRICEREVTNTINIDLTKVVDKEVSLDDIILHMNDGEEIELTGVSKEIIEKLK